MAPEKLIRTDSDVAAADMKKMGSVLLASRNPIRINHSEWPVEVTGDTSLTPLTGQRRQSAVRRNRLHGGHFFPTALKKV
jgi:hypothetical protein